MTEATYKKKKNSAQTDNRISTHPSYTEYAWDSLVSDETKASTVSTQNINRVNAAPAANTGRAGTVRRSGRTATGTAAKAKVKTAADAETRKKARAQAADNIKKKSIVAMHTVVVEKKYAFPMSIVMLTACFTVLIMAIVTTSVQINEITGENAALSRTYTALVNEENELRLLLETRDDLRIVETVAKEELGMVKKDQVERYYLTVNKEDRIEIIEESDEGGESLFDGVMNLGGSLVERIRGFFGM